MTGRGFSFRPVIKKPEVEKEKQESAAPSTLSSAASSATSIGTLKAGFGRGIAFPKLAPPTCLNNQKEPALDSATSIGSSSQVSSSTVGLGRGMSIGRSMFAIRKEESLTSGASSLETKITESQPAGSGSSGQKLPFMAGRGTSGRGTNSRDDSENKSRNVRQQPSECNSSETASSAAKALGTIPKTLGSKNSASITIPTELSEDNEPVLKHGSKGSSYTSMTNSFKLHCNPDAGVFEYEVRFNPAVDEMNFRYKYVAAHKELLGNAKTFDGVTLFLPRKLPDEKTHLVSKSITDDTDVNVEIKFKRKKRLGECIQLYNILFDKIFKILNYLRVGRKNFDPTSPILIPRQKLEIWPGYVNAVEEQEGGLMLSLDVSHRVLATRSVLEVMTEAIQNNRNYFKDNIKKLLIGRIVLTRYNNKTYRIDEILFDQTPESTFKRGDTEVSYLDYYKQQYNITIRDRKQFLLVSRKEVLVAGEREKRELLLLLVPELCFATGLSDDMRTNHTVMKDLAAFTKISPPQRVAAFRKYTENVNSNPLAKEVLSMWGLSLDAEPVKLQARVFDNEKIIFGRGRELDAGVQADFSRHATNNEVLDPVNIQKWLLVFSSTDKNTAETFHKTLLKISGPTGIQVDQPRLVSLPNDRTETYVNAIRKELSADPKIQIVVAIFPSQRDDRYAAIKQVLCAEIPTPSQVINSRTLRNEAKNRSIIQKILLQMNCKLGGTLWSIKIPLQKTMICGIDTYHTTTQKGNNVGGFVASLNATFTRWYSRPTLQEKREELVNGLTASMEAALTAYKEFNHGYPDRIILYRDGVGDGQLDFVKKYEISQFRYAFTRINPDYNPTLTFVVVQKRIRTKFFKMTPGQTEEKGLVNPPPGSVLDHTVTSRFLYDFYLVSQHVREGTTTPSHYIVLEDDNKFDPDILQRLTYKLCYLYYNWPGTVRVPAPCQYAHKLADLIGESVKRNVGNKLADKLYFL